jgi:hypothetical protein
MCCAEVTWRATSLLPAQSLLYVMMSLAWRHLKHSWPATMDREGVAILLTTARHESS